MGRPDAGATLSPPDADTSAPLPSGDALARSFQEVRSFTEALTEGLAPEDMVVQSMADVSPTKWHLAHTSWFFERFILMEHAPGYRPYDETYLYLFNSYYHQAGERHCRDQRGYLSRPTVAEVRAYRRHVDDAMQAFLAREEALRSSGAADLVTLGLNHEQQHQELLLTDIKHVFSVNPLRPVYRAPDGEGGGVSAGRNGISGGAGTGSGGAPPIRWIGEEGGVQEIGDAGEGFVYDNEAPRHRVFLEPFELADRLVTCGEYLEFIEDGGYDRPELWLSLGWATVRKEGWREPFYWEWRDGAPMLFTLGGMREVNPAEPVGHLSYFEADAFARWAGARLPTEAEWEVAAATRPIEGNFADGRTFHPAPASSFSAESSGSGRGLRQMYGDLWEWTASPYAPYPRFRPAAGAVGEYNGKFMCNQYVLRGGSCATSRSHIRATYRNFFPPEATWQFSGLRLARDVP